MKVGIVCPYSFDVPGGVQAHVVDLARALKRLGHEVNVLAPADEDSGLPDFVTSAGRAVGIPYNGSVARLSFGPVSYARVRRWIRENDFDVLHLHEPTAPSLSFLALMVADGPIVATFHTSTPRSKILAAFQVVLQPFVEKITARIAVSALARRVQVEHLGGDAVEIPNGVDVGFFADAAPLEGYPREGGTIGFVGRYTEPRKGMPVLLEAVRLLAPELPDLRLLVVGRGDDEELLKSAGPELAERIVLLGQVDDETKARALRSVDVYCAPNTGGESFGIILTEAMSAGTAVAASDLDAFRRVLEDGKSGVLTPVEDSAALAAALRGLLADAGLRAQYAENARQRVMTFDWSVVANQVLRVYESAMAADPRRVAEAAE
ncbi:glycosyltransferase family 4 protein [Umezawaea tangerina]|uniref:Phosphatidylinositol alpha-mannosyltransferase n=1 Tax=Umezawaea tangerina TaxID=84725 RepID=A0A2T0T3U2_9PSEU|nr:glycosyltransferase family 4 protein [Umezawaea tangerina]PRY40299.1 phosphatidylinositol alpha-mannosyltransferase [Umezawaea tangerina]